MDNPTTNTKTSRCSQCKKRLGLMTFTCGCCNEMFCVIHRMPEEHTCASNFKQKAQEEFKTQFMKTVQEQTEASNDHRLLKMS